MMVLEQAFAALKSISPLLGAAAGSMSGWDWAAFMCCWPGLALYSAVAKWRSQNRDSLSGASARSRMGWARSLAARPAANRMMDASILATYNNSAVFFSSSALLALGAFLSLAASPERAKDAMDAFGALTHGGDMRSFLAKAVVAAGFFGWAFLKFTWSMRQIAFAGAIGGGIDERGQANEGEVQAFAKLATMAGESFNDGLRSFYWSMAACCWLISPGMCVACAGALAIGLWRREFLSPTLKAMGQAYPFGKERALPSKVESVAEQSAASALALPAASAVLFHAVQSLAGSDALPAARDAGGRTEPAPSQKEQA